MAKLVVALLVVVLALAGALVWQMQRTQMVVSQLEAQRAEEQEETAQKLQVELQGSVSQLAALKAEAESWKSDFTGRLSGMAGSFADLQGQFVAGEKHVASMLQQSTQVEERLHGLQKQFDGQAMAWQAQADKAQQSLQSGMDQLNQQTAQLRNMQGQLQGYQQNLGSLTGQVANLKGQVGGVAAQANNVTTKISQAEKQLKQLQGSQARIAKLEKDLAAKSMKLDELIKKLEGGSKLLQGFGQ